MARSENVIQPPPNSTGLPVRLLQITRPDGTVVNMEAVAVADPDDPNSVAKVTFEGESLTIDRTTNELLFLIMNELIEIKHVLSSR